MIEVHWTFFLMLPGAAFLCGMAFETGRSQKEFDALAAEADRILTINEDLIKRLERP